MQAIITEKTWKKEEDILSFTLKDVTEVNGPYTWSFKCRVCTLHVQQESLIFLSQPKF